jgi:hypothetical protein
MKRPSAQALDLADEILDHVRHGLTRADALYELADLIDDHNAELLRAIRRLLGDAAHGGGSPGHLLPLAGELMWLPGLEEATFESKEEVHIENVHIRGRLPASFIDWLPA